MGKTISTTIHNNPPHSFNLSAGFFNEKQSNPSLQFNCQHSCRVTYVGARFLYLGFILYQRFINALYIHFDFHCFDLLIYGNCPALYVVIQAFTFSIFQECDIIIKKILIIYMEFNYYYKGSLWKLYMLYGWRSILTRNF